MAKKAKAAPVSYPISHWSNSSMLDFLSNPLIFKKKWILKVPSDDSSMSAMIGKAAHLALKTIFGGNDEIPVSPKVAEAAPLGIAAGLKYLDEYPDGGIRYGKTGSRQIMLAKYSKAVQWYIDEMPEWDLVSVEESMQEFLTGPDGGQFAIPMKGLTDLIVRKPNGRLRIIDHKFVGSYTEPDEESAIKILQAMFLKYLVKSAHGEEPEDIIFRECKTTENKDGSVQTKEYGIEYAKVPHYDALFFRLYADCTRALVRPDVIFLPNLRDIMTGDEALLLYQQNLLGVDMSDVVVDHNTHHVRYMPKESKFSESVLATVDAASFLPEERVRVKLGEFGIPVKAGEVHHGPSVTLYTFTPSRGVSVKRVEQHAQDIALALRAHNVRIIAPIPGTNSIGVEVPREDRETIAFTDALIRPDTFEIPIGMDLYGKTVKKDIRRMPHLLVAGATGAGKSVFINSVIHTLVKQQPGSNLQLVLIDPKQVELAQWDGHSHVSGPVIYTVYDAVRKLDEIVGIMESRYKKLRTAGARSIEQYGAGMPYIVVVIDEFADLIMSREKIQEVDLISGRKSDKIVAGSEIETSVIRLAQKGRAAGIHLIVGTQRPSVNVITGLIKANIPTRVAFMTASVTDSKVILDTKGAEELLGRGDMLFMDPGEKGLARLQGFYLQ